MLTYFNILPTLHQNIGEPNSTKYSQFFNPIKRSEREEKTLVTKEYVENDELITVSVLLERIVYEYENGEIVLGKWQQIGEEQIKNKNSSW